MTRTFDRITSPPSDSARYSVRAAGVPHDQADVERRWAVGPPFPLDQGVWGRCVGYGLAAELAAEPVAVPADEATADALYRAAQAQDRAEGLVVEGEGASVLGGLRAARAMGLIEGFAWAQTSAELLDAVLCHGPVVLGTEWLTGMDVLDGNALATAMGPSRGGHCYVIVGSVPWLASYGPCYALLNSWGPSYGRGGIFYLRRRDVDRLVFGLGGEAAIITDQPVVPAG